MTFFKRIFKSTLNLQCSLLSMYSARNLFLLETIIERYISLASQLINAFQNGHKTLDLIFLTDDEIITLIDFTTNSSITKVQCFGSFLRSSIQCITEPKTKQLLKFLFEMYKHILISNRYTTSTQVYIINNIGSNLLSFLIWGKFCIKIEAINILEIYFTKKATINADDLDLAMNIVNNTLAIVKSGCLNVEDGSSLITQLNCLILTIKKVSYMDPNFNEQLDKIIYANILTYSENQCISDSATTDMIGVLSNTYHDVPPIFSTMQACPAILFLYKYNLMDQLSKLDFTYWNIFKNQLLSMLSFLENTSDATLWSKEIKKWKTIFIFVKYIYDDAEESSVTSACDFEFFDTLILKITQNCLNFIAKSALTFKATTAILDLIYTFCNLKFCCDSVKKYEVEFSQLLLSPFCLILQLPFVFETIKNAFLKANMPCEVIINKYLSHFLICLALRFSKNQQIIKIFFEILDYTMNGKNVEIQKICIKQTIPMIMATNSISTIFEKILYKGLPNTELHTAYSEVLVTLSKLRHGEVWLYSTTSNQIHDEVLLNEKHTKKENYSGTFFFLKNL